MTGRSVALGLVLLLPVIAARQASAHPGIGAAARCSSCHVDKTRGKSVHSAMAITCMVCHTLTTRGGSTVIELTAPKETICFGCHERSSEKQQHSPKVRGQCVDCHDSHSSPRRMLLLEPAARKKPH